MDDVQLAEAIKREVSALRSQGRIPTEVALSDDAWNVLRRQLTFGAFGDRQAVQFAGLPCVLVYGLTDPRGFRVSAIEPRE